MVSHDRRYRLTVRDNLATIVYARRTVQATRAPCGTVTYSGRLPARVKRATAHELNRSAIGGHHARYRPRPSHRGCTMGKPRIV